MYRPLLQESTRSGQPQAIYLSLKQQNYQVSLKFVHVSKQPSIYIVSMLMHMFVLSVHAWNVLIQYVKIIQVVQF